MPIPIVVRIFGGTAMFSAACACGYFSALMLRKSYKQAGKGIATPGTVIGFNEQMSGGADRNDVLPLARARVREASRPSGPTVASTIASGAKAN